jgi:Tfp pilus assembly protein PilN
MRINLLPPEVGERQKLRRRTLATIGVGIVLLALVGGFYFLQVIRLSGVEEDIQAQEAVNADLQRQISELQDVAALEQEISATRQLLSTLLQDRVLWSGVLRDISLVIPSELWLDGLTGQVGAGAAVGADAEAPVALPGTEGGLVGQISFTGSAFSHREVALWLSRLEDVRGFINPWLASSTKVSAEAVAEDGTVIAPTGPELVNFASSVDLSDQALARRTGGSP